MIPVIASLVAMVISAALFMVGAIALPQTRRTDRMMVAGLLGMVLSALAVGGSLASVLP